MIFKRDKMVKSTNRMELEAQLVGCDRYDVIDDRR